jgi:hypothetical protein
VKGDRHVHGLGGLIEMCAFFSEGLLLVLHLIVVLRINSLSLIHSTCLSLYLPNLLLKEPVSATIGVNKSGDGHRKVESMV